MDPGQVAGEGGEEVEQRPGDDDIVVETNIEGDEDDREAYTCRTDTRHHMFYYFNLQP